MPNPSTPPTATTLSGFNEIAARRGDGLHPLLLAALTKFGSVSGPPPLSEQTGENVVKVDFAAEGASKTRSKAAPR